MLLNRKLPSIPSILKRLHAVKEEVSQIEAIVYKVVAQADRIAEVECSAAPLSNCGQAFCNSRSLFNNYDN